MAMGAGVLMDTLEELSNGTLVRTPQTGESNYAPMLTKETGHIDWSKSAQGIHNLVRGLNSWPGAFTEMDGKKYKIWLTKMTGQKTSAEPGTIVKADKKEGLWVAAGDELLQITELQAPGKKKMRAADYLNGHGISLPAQFH
jgi:methionyl-tRNA formyltransferase